MMISPVKIKLGGGDCVLQLRQKCGLERQRGETLRIHRAAHRKPYRCANPSCKGGVDGRRIHDGQQRPATEALL